MRFCAVYHILANINDVMPDVGLDVISNQGTMRVLFYCGCVVDVRGVCEGVRYD